MTVLEMSRRLLAHESRAMLARLARIEPFALTMPMVPAAACSVEAQNAIEQHMQKVKRGLRRLIVRFLDQLRGAPRHGFVPHAAQEQFTLLRMRFNSLITQFDIFGDVLSQRSEHGTGVRVAGLDAVVTDALNVPGVQLDVPPVMCYLDRGHGAAIRRVRTRLPGGDLSPVAVINVPRERMIGSGVASSLVHEAGHQAAALLELIPSLRVPLIARQRTAPPKERQTWLAWERWISEILSDFWSVGKLGIGATTGLMAVVSLPRPFVFRLDLEDPHPFPWIRVRLSGVLGRTLYPHVQWDRLLAVWDALYPRTGLAPSMLQWLAQLEGTLPQFVTLLLGHKPKALAGRALKDLFPNAERSPARLASIFDQHRQRPASLAAISPTLAFAAIGQARMDGKLDPEAEGNLLRELLTVWAVRGSLGSSQRCARGQMPAAFNGRRATVPAPAA
ncbi:MAG: hypothetical protein L0211_16070 [Planctomycetaceae bacterium]|nr:hypothetical protein [Planctomycetaceae bacterium]